MENRFYIVNKNGAKTLAFIRKGLVHADNGAPTGKPLSHYLKNGCSVQKA